LGSKAKKIKIRIPTCIPQQGNGETTKDSGSIKRALNPSIHEIMMRKKVSISALCNEGTDKEKFAHALPNRKGGRKRECKKADLQQAVIDVPETEGKKASTQSKVKKT
jgi:hypothetical protein